MTAHQSRTKDGKEVSETTHPLGSTRASIETDLTAVAALEIGELVADDAQLSVAGVSSDDEADHVECKVELGSAELHLTLTTDDARALSNELATAADTVKEGSR